MLGEKGSSFKIIYEIKCEKEEDKCIFDIDIDRKTLLIKNTLPKIEWAKMDYFACSICPVKDKFDYCPLAIQLPGIIKYFANKYSYQIAEIKVITEEREYFLKTSIQRGLSSLLGIIMPASGCPILAKLKPMVPFHLPFATPEETEYRVFSTYLFAQFLRWKNGLEPDWEMKNLGNIYEEIRLVNQNVVDKLKELSQKDANLNAVVILDTFTEFISMSLEDTDFSDLSHYFEVFLDRTKI